jgi:hypothetical protein
MLKELCAGWFALGPLLAPGICCGSEVTHALSETAKAIMYNLFILPYIYSCKVMKTFFSTKLQHSDWQAGSQCDQIQDIRFKLSWQIEYDSVASTTLGPLGRKEG